jgi:hypothetical protein
MKRRCAYCRKWIDEPCCDRLTAWCSYACYQADRDRWLEDRHDGERTERRINESRPNQQHS